MGLTCLILSVVFVYFSVPCIIRILIGKGKKANPTYDTAEKRNNIYKKGRNWLIFILILLMLHLTIVFIFYSNDAVLSNYLVVFIFGLIIYFVQDSIKCILIGKGKRQNPAYETVEKKKYILRNGIIQLVLSLTFLVLFITVF
jgi:hypothetical protein